MAEIPSVEVLLSFLSRCRKHKDLPYARCFHAQVCSYGLDAQAVIGNHIVPMFVECGSIMDAEQAFHRLEYKNVHTWTSLISAYTEYGQADFASTLYQKMQEGSCQPSSYTLVALVKECAASKDTKKGYDLHVEIIHKGFDSDLFAGSALIDMYTKFGWLSEASSIFDKLPVRDVVSWNTLIAGYAEYCPNQGAFDLFEQMKFEEISPTVSTFTSSLKACCNLGDASKGQALHMEVTKRGVESDLFIGNTLIDMYAKLGALSDAQIVFDNHLIRDVVSWNVLIAGYAEHGPFHITLQCYEQMHVEGVLPDEVTFVYYLKACGSLGAVEKGREMDREISRQGYEKSLLVGNTLVGMYAKCGALSQAQQAFDNLMVKDIVTWNALITGYAEHGYDREALECLDEMTLNSVGQDAITYVCGLKACGNVEAVKRGQQMHLEVTKKGFDVDLIVGSTLIEMYGKCGSLTDAQAVFDRLPSRDVMCWNALIAGYAEHGPFGEVSKCFHAMQLEELSPDNCTFSCMLKSCRHLRAKDQGKEMHVEVAKVGLETDVFVGSALVDMYANFAFLLEAQKVFELLAVRDIALWNALITGYVEHGPVQEALKCYDRMQTASVLPNTVTFVSILKGCGSIGAIDKGQESHLEITQRGLGNDLFVGNTLIHMYAKCGLLLEACDAFEKLQLRDAASWNAIIKGCGMNNEGDKAVEYFDRMQEQGVRPDAVTFTCLLSACCRANLINKGQELLSTMTNKYGIVPSFNHFSCMVELLARSGRLNEAERFLDTMPSSPSKFLWTALMSACKLHTDSEIGQRCFEQLVEMSQNCATSYTLMAEICANAGWGIDMIRGEEQRKDAEEHNKFSTAMTEVNIKLKDFLIRNVSSSITLSSSEKKNPVFS